GLSHGSAASSATAASVWRWPTVGCFTIARMRPRSGPASSAKRHRLPTSSINLKLPVDDSSRMPEHGGAPLRTSHPTVRLSMQRTSIPALVLPALLAAFALHSPSAGRADDATAVDKLNKKLAFSLADAAGKPWSLASLKDNKAVVVVFLSFDCPVSNSYAPTLIELYKTYADKGVAFVAINASDDLTAAELARQAGEFKLPFPVLKDDRCKVAELCQARVSPEAFVLDHNHVL